MHCYIIKENIRLNLPHFQLNSLLKTIKIIVEISSHNEQKNSNNHKSILKYRSRTNHDKLIKAPVFVADTCSCLVKETKDNSSK